MIARTLVMIAAGAITAFAAFSILCAVLGLS